MDNELFKIFDKDFKAYKLTSTIYPVDIYIVLDNTNKFSVKYGSQTNTLYKEKIPIDYVDDITGYSEQMFINNFFSCIITIGINDEYFSKCENKYKEIQGTIVHEIQHCIGNIYNRIEQKYEGNEHDAYLACYLYNRINEIIEYDTYLENNK